jgi:hypothetical protein
VNQTISTKNLLYFKKKEVKITKILRIKIKIENHSAKNNSKQKDKLNSKTGSNQKDKLKSK